MSKDPGRRAVPVRPKVAPPVKSRKGAKGDKGASVTDAGPRGSLYAGRGPARTGAGRAPGGVEPGRRAPVSGPPRPSAGGGARPPRRACVAEGPVGWGAVGRGHGGPTEGALRP